MKKVLMVLAVALVVCLSGVSVQALPAPPWFAYDNFELTYGTMGSPGSANGTFVSSGQITNFADPAVILGYFSLTGTNPVGAQLVAGQYITVYNSTLTLFADFSHSTTIWTGTGTDRTIVNADGSVFPINLARPPAYALQPANYNSIGDGAFSGAATVEVPFTELKIVLGTFNWSYNNDDPTKVTIQHGNAQGNVGVPEPGLLLLLGAGLIGVLGLRSKSL
jgi:hypothetical protein